MPDKLWHLSKHALNRAGRRTRVNYNDMGMQRHSARLLPVNNCFACRCSALLLAGWLGTVAQPCTLQSSLQCSAVQLLRAERSFRLQQCSMHVVQVQTVDERVIS